jgi:hypothetical protein
MTASQTHRYKSTESKYKGGAQDMYVTYDESQATTSGRKATYPKVKRVYVAGQVKGWHVGVFTNRAGRQVHGVKVEYEQTRAGYSRKPYSGVRGTTPYKVSAATVGSGRSHFTKIMEVPKDARNIHFYTGKLPSKYQQARQRVR